MLRCLLEGYLLPFGMERYLRQVCACYYVLGATVNIPLVLLTPYTYLCIAGYNIKSFLMQPAWSVDIVMVGSYGATEELFNRNNGLVR